MRGQEAPPRASCLEGGEERESLGERERQTSRKKLSTMGFLDVDTLMNLDRQSQVVVPVGLFEANDSGLDPHESKPITMGPYEQFYLLSHCALALPSLQNQQFPRICSSSLNNNMF
jgi:hypothetical protein